MMNDVIITKDDSSTVFLMKLLNNLSYTFDVNEELFLNTYSINISIIFYKKKIIRRILPEEKVIINSILYEYLIREIPLLEWNLKHKRKYSFGKVVLSNARYYQICFILFINYYYDVLKRNKNYSSEFDRSVNSIFNLNITINSLLSFTSCISWCNSYFNNFKYLKQYLNTDNYQDDLLLILIDFTKSKTHTVDDLLTLYSMNEYYTYFYMLEKSNYTISWKEYPIYSYEKNNYILFLPETIVKNTIRHQYSCVINWENNSNLLVVLLQIKKFVQNIFKKHYKFYYNEKNKLVFLKSVNNKYYNTLNFIAFAEDWYNRRKLDLFPVKQINYMIYISKLTPLDENIFENIVMTIKLHRCICMLEKLKYKFIYTRNVKMNTWYTLYPFCFVT